MATISTLAVNLIARTSVFERGMKRSRKSMGRFRGETKRTSAGVLNFAKSMLIAGGAVVALKSFTKAASDAQETMNLFNTVFAENANATTKWANEFAKNVGRGKTEVKEWAAALQDTFVPLGFARDRAAELSKTLVELAVDVGSFKNIASDREVIDSFTSAIVGNHRAVRAYGVVITNATIEAESFASGINKVFTKLTELEKVQLRYNIILKSTKDAQGDALKTADNYSNKVKGLKGNIQDLKEAIGNGLLPAMTDLVSTMDDVAGSANSFDRVGRSIARITDLVKGFAGVLQSVIGWVQFQLHAALNINIVAVKTLITLLAGLNNELAKSPIGGQLGLTEININPLFKAMDEIGDTFGDSAKKNMREGALKVANAIKGESVKSFNKMIAEANKLLSTKAVKVAQVVADSQDKIKRLMERVKAGDPALNKLLSDATKDPAKEPGRGRFQETRSKFIDLAALGGRDKNTGIEKNNMLTETTNRILEEMNRRNMGAFQA